MFKRMNVNKLIKDEKYYNDMTEDEFKKENKANLKSYLKQRPKLWITILLFIIFIAVIIYSLIDSYNSYVRNSLVSNIMYQQELYADVVIRDVKTLLTIYNSETFETAKKSLSLTDELYNNLFGDRNYVEDSSEKMPVVSILNIEYNLSDDIDDKCFLITAKKQVDDKTRFYKIFVSLYNDKIEKLEITKL